MRKKKSEVPVVPAGPVGIVTDEFREVHSFRVDIPGSDDHVRFQNLHCAVRTALHLKSTVVDERSGNTYNSADCLSISINMPRPTHKADDSSMTQSELPGGRH